MCSKCSGFTASTEVDEEVTLDGNAAPEVPLDGENKEKVAKFSYHGGVVV